LKVYRAYKKVMSGLVWVEKLILCLVTVLVTGLTFANVCSRYVFHASLSFTEELVVAVFVLMSLMGAALCAREENGLISMSLFTGFMSRKWQRVFNVFLAIVSIAFCIVLFKTGLDKVLTQIANGKETFSLRWPEWVFTVYLPIGGGCMILHFLEFAIDNIVGDTEEGLNQ
jgi:TRAP-type C4-dicarboxylate transport system permease small subunit